MLRMLNLFFSQQSCVSYRFVQQLSSKAGSANARLVIGMVPIGKVVKENTGSTYWTRSVSGDDHERGESS